MVSDPCTPSLTMLVRNWMDCTSPTWCRYLDLIGLIGALMDEENQ